MAATFVCDICSDYIFGGEAFYGQQEGEPVVSCFDCYLAELKTFTVNGETVRYNAASRDLDPNDWVVFYDRDGHVLSKIALHKIADGQLGPAKAAVAVEVNRPVEHITIVIEAHDHDVKKPAV